MFLRILPVCTQYFLTKTSAASVSASLQLEKLSWLYLHFILPCSTSNIQQPGSPISLTSNSLQEYLILVCYTQTFWTVLA